MFLFVIFGAVALVAAVGVVTNRKPVYSALFLLLHFASLAALYVMLQAQFLAMVQIIVYAGAIVVLFLFVVMLIGGGESPDLARANGKAGAGARWPRFVALALAAALLASLGYGAAAGALSTAQGSAAAFGEGSVQAIGQTLYTGYVFPFELTSVLLLVGMIGAVVLGRRE